METSSKNKEKKIYAKKDFDPDLVEIFQQAFFSFPRKFFLFVKLTT